MRIGKDTLTKKSLELFNAVYNESFRNRISSILHLQDKVIRKIDIEANPEHIYPASVVTLFIKLRLHFNGILIALGIGNVITANIVLRVLFDHLVMIFYIASRPSLEEKKKLSHELYPRFLREILRNLLSFYGLFEKNLPLYSKSSEVKRIISNFTSEEQKELLTGLNKLKFAEVNNKYLPKKLREELKSSTDLIEFFLVNHKYWSITNDRTPKNLNNFKELCDKNDEIIDEYPDKFRIFGSKFFFNRYITLYKLCCNDIHPSYKDSDDIIKDDFQTAYFAQSFDRDNVVVTLIEIMLYACWIIDTELELGLNREIGEQFLSFHEITIK